MTAPLCMLPQRLVTGTLTLWVLSGTALVLFSLLHPASLDTVLTSDGCPVAAQQSIAGGGCWQSLWIMLLLPFCHVEFLLTLHVGSHLCSQLCNCRSTAVLILPLFQVKQLYGASVPCKMSLCCRGTCWSRNCERGGFHLCSVTAKPSLTSSRCCLYSRLWISWPKCHPSVPWVPNCSLGMTRVPLCKLSSPFLQCHQSTARCSPLYWLENSWQSKLCKRKERKMEPSCPKDFFSNILIQSFSHFWSLLNRSCIRKKNQGVGFWGLRGDLMTLGSENVSPGLLGEVNTRRKIVLTCYWIISLLFFCFF